jgi:hypothetical protein
VNISARVRDETEKSFKKLETDMERMVSTKVKLSDNIFIEDYRQLFVKAQKEVL